MISSWYIVHNANYNNNSLQSSKLNNNTKNLTNPTELSSQTSIEKQFLAFVLPANNKPFVSAVNCKTI